MSRVWNVFKSLTKRKKVHADIKNKSVCYSWIQSYIDWFGNNLIASYSPKITQLFDEQYQQAVMTHIVLFALQINSECLSQWYLSKSRKCQKLSSPSNKLACCNFLMQDSGLLTVHEWRKDKGRKQSLQEVGKKVYVSS